MFTSYVLDTAVTHYTSLATRYSLVGNSFFMLACPYMSVCPIKKKFLQLLINSIRCQRDFSHSFSSLFEGELESRDESTLLQIYVRNVFVQHVSVVVRGEDQASIRDEDCPFKILCCFFPFFWEIMLNLPECWFFLKAVEEGMYLSMKLHTLRKQMDLWYLQDGLSGQMREYFKDLTEISLKVT